jgi:hypothetical protein
LKEDPELQKLEWNGRQIRNGKSCSSPRAYKRSVVDEPYPAFQTAVSLAEFDASGGVAAAPLPCKFCSKNNHLPENCWVKYKEKTGKKVFLKEKHFIMVTNMSKRFQDFIERTTGGSYSKHAKGAGLRDDNYEDGKPPKEHTKNSITRQAKEQTAN